jgi:hypothetical protein
MANPYKFQPGDTVSIVSIVGRVFEGCVFTMYTSDMFTHSAAPHRRYVVKTLIDGLFDVSEGELEATG